MKRDNERLHGSHCRSKGQGPFLPRSFLGASVYVNDLLTIDFVDPQLLGVEDNRVPIQHYCFRVSDAVFDAILERVTRMSLKYSSAQKLPEPDCKIYKLLGGRGFYFREPDGHSWEILTVSYARPAE